VTSADNLLAVSIYVLYRTPEPCEETKKEMMKKLKEYDITVNQLVEWSSDHCEPGDVPKEKEKRCSV
jgi:hypothetical protein